jgi:hypothetical protein
MTITPVPLDLAPRNDWPCRWARLMILAAVVLSTVRLIEAEPLQSANDRSRWTTVWSLVERGTFQIDEIRKVPGWDTIDKVRHEGHFYSSKPPLLTTIVAGLYWTVKHTLGWTIVPTDLNATASVARLILWLINILPTAIALELLARLVWRSTASTAIRAFILTTACFGTLWCAYLPSLNNHTPALCCVAIALALIAGVDGLTHCRGRTFLAGLFAGFAAVFELPAAAFLAGLAAWLLLTPQRKRLPVFLIAAAIPVAGHFITNYMAAGTWKPFYASYGTEKYNYLEEGIPSYWLEPKGVDKATDPFGTYLFHCLIGHHGLLSLTPVLLLGLLGAFRVRRWKSTPLAPVHLLGIGLTIVVLGFYLSRPANFNYGGVSVGLRWIIWLIPFWLLLLIPGYEGWIERKPARCVSFALLAISIFSAWHPFNAPWKQPWLFDWMEARGWINYREPPPQFPHPVHSWIFQLPDGPAKQDDYWVELTGVELDGRALTLKISDGGPIDIEGRAARRVEFLWNAGQESERTQVATFDTAKFAAGDDLANCLLWPNANTTDSDKADVTELVQGVPTAATYTCTAQRYTKLPLRTDAFHCYVGVTAGARRSKAPGISVVAIRSEAWMSDEIPFGIALWEVQTSNYQTGSPLARRRLSVIQVGKLVSPASSTRAGP